MGWFSGSSNTDNSSSSSSATVTDFASDDAHLQSPTSPSSIGTGPTAALKQRIQQEAAMANARALVTSINQNCYEHCVTKPGASLSKGEETCLTACMEKYMGTWNTTSRAYVARLQQESQQRGLLGGASLNMSS